MWTTGFPKGPHRRCFKASSDRRLAAEPTGFVTPRLPALASPFRGSGDAHRHVRLWASGIYGWGVSQSTRKCGTGEFSCRVAEKITNCFNGEIPRLFRHCPNATAAVASIPGASLMQTRRHLPVRPTFYRNVAVSPRYLNKAVRSRLTQRFRIGVTKGDRRGVAQSKCQHTSDTLAGLIASRFGVGRPDTDGRSWCQRSRDEEGKGRWQSQRHKRGSPISC